ncbi:multiple coagulation factor deficiency protein 2 homolog isoform X1 [Cephus cinctus]|uniref:Multiple coagulation factor deficiency protein 2 homolog isoform X1 n=1 Tax=Cephus cinctus TaxID=211228 RepID=A0AAJ7BXJ4_CEPCN|nr:multiple coagulation factor deficiency protein 2 homolog isoform X1 [Cephus cinctus]
MYWILWIFIIGASSCQFVDAQGHRVAPGVHPQHYQQQFPSQQMHHVPQHQVPQQQYQQVQQQQVPVQQQGHDHVHPQQLLSAANIAQEKAHIAEHLDVPMDTSKMSEQELQFHYFKMHDADNNNKLDGCELIKSLIHWHEQGNRENGAPNAGDKLFKDDELVALIDPILGMDDTNKDGFIDYPEFIRAQQKAAATGRQ